ncbi:MAG: crossover junction endodeoxyribonuclease RuvC [Holosporaceae bacterium]|nr:crossover junction endodeoxyribonuclease RuvC [Holosporaceae bacterium]
MSRILGIDPGLRITGWGIIDRDGFHTRHVAHGTIVSETSEEISLRLSRIFRELSDVIEKYSPHEAGIEDVFVNRNPFSSLKLGMARGVAVCCAGFFGLKIAEYSANKIKKSVVGSGHAEKNQVSMMVQKLLNCDSVKQDAADALAVAICHAHHNSFYAAAGI